MKNNTATVAPNTPHSTYSENDYTWSCSEFFSRFAIGEERYCRYLWSPRIQKGHWPWRPLGTRQSGKRTFDLHSFFNENAELQGSSTDCYFSPNEYFDWRNEQQLSLLRANWLEIDINEKGKKSLSLAEENIVIKEVFMQLEHAGIPKPSCYVKSGSGGVHLYWIYEPVEAFKWRIKAWKAFANKLIDGVKGGNLWHVDRGASNNPCRVMRLPGTRHGATGDIVDAFIADTHYTFGELAENMGVDASEPTLIEISKVQSTRKRDKKEPVNSSDKKSTKHNIKTWWANVYWQVSRHILSGGAKVGNRNNIAYICYVAMWHVAGEEEALHRVMELNSNHIGLKENDLIAYLATAKRKGYRYRKETLAEFLESEVGMDASFLYQNSKIKLSKEEVKQRQSLAAQTTTQKRRTTSLEAIIRALKHCIEQGITVTQQAVSTICGRSERTVRRYWHSNDVQAVIRCPSVYTPLGEVAGFR